MTAALVVLRAMLVVLALAVAYVLWSSRDGCTWPLESEPRPLRAGCRDVDAMP